MKKKLLMGLIGLSCLLPLGVNAETNEEGVVKQESASATVGEVETPVYNVEIKWDSLEFDWKYNNETNQYEWKVKTDLLGLPLNEWTRGADWWNEEYFEEEKHNIYEDLESKKKISEDLSFEEVNSNIEKYYYAHNEEKLNEIHIRDSSTHGEITPSVKWTSSEGYEYVQGTFEYKGKVCQLVENEDLFNHLIEYNEKIYSDLNCTTKIPESSDYENNFYYEKGLEWKKLTTEEVPENGRTTEDGSEYYYTLALNLENKTRPTSTPETGDEIGIITVTLKAN